MFLHNELLKSHRISTKKGSIGWRYVVSIIVGLMVFGLLIWIAMQSKETILGFINQLKGMI
ncbi:hypothetical protein K9M79_02775 [Candidatus Woesearchaeota archaeon]|nr:hypothetical protein [Candidatus Woesearchaeota archaeon]